ncbi:DUF2238 domain-containing protein [Paenibacillus sp. HJGM_3]|uniref:DUF2238 domain-containing protein n=1 Tax=Paenibacillus sp. HJGM_3 TaxID=3379816 RepID=UPI00385A0363
MEGRDRHHEKPPTSAVQASPYRVRGWKGNRLLHGMLLLYAAYWIVAAIKPTSRGEWLLENILVALTALVLGLTYRKFKFSNLSYFFILLYLVFHTYGAHYTYSATPFDNWLKSAFDTKRSYYDRVVHFLFGFLLAYPVREWFVRLSGLAKQWTLLIPIILLVTFSSIFEIFEMRIALIMKSQLARDYVGLQGDVWDSVKDIEMGLLGAVLGSLGLYIWYRRKARKPG